MELPVYNALIEDTEDGIFAVSLVKSPATLVNWLAFKNEEEKKPLFFVNDEEQRIITSVLMVADTPIYRRNGDYEYYIQYSKDVLKQMAEKVLMDNALNNIDVEHNGEILDRGLVQARELYIKDVERGINPAGMEEVPDGSLMVTYHINDDAIWSSIKEGTWQGFSLAGLFTVKESYNNKINKHNKMSKMNQLKTLLREILCEFGTIKLEDGTEVEIASDEIAEGVAIELEDGEYKTEDGKVIEVKEGVIVSIGEPVAEEKPEEPEPVEEEPKEEPEEPKEEEVPEEEKPEEPKEEVVEEPVEEPVEEEPKEEVIEEPKEEEVITPEEAIEEIVDVVEPEAEPNPLEERIAELEKQLAEIIAILKKPVQPGIVDEFDPNHKPDEVKPMFSVPEYNKWGLKK